MALQPSSSSFSYKFTYDVFLSFRGEDTRYAFTGNLDKALCNKGIHTFIDDHQVPRGDQITSALYKAIEESRIFIIVLSHNYASSSFCLSKLAHILNFIKGKGILVLPIFYNVDPSHVRHHRGSFGEALANHEKKFKADKEGFEHNMKKLEEWKKALRDAANLSGYHFKHGDGYEHEFIQKIVELVSSKINRVPLPIADYPVGLESQVLKVKKLLDVRSNGVVHMVGIHGLGGIGKTTLAVAVYNSIADYFEGLCFLENVRETSYKYGLLRLQSNLLSEIVGEKDIRLTNVRQGISIIQHRLQRKKVLLILDDVDKQKQLDAIVGRPNWFGPGSRVIITTRDKQLLACHGVERMYEVEELKKEDALQLLSWKAFKKDKIDPSYEGVLNQAVTYASGLPLALEVIGSNLFRKNTEQWKSALNRYEGIPNKAIQEILKVSYDALEEDQQNVFLDIACCFKECELAKVQDILHAHHDNCMKYHIEVLVDKSLIKINRYGEVTLHDLIEDMGKEIVRKESPNEPGKRSRLWFPEDIADVLEKNKGSSQIEIIFWDFFFYKEREVEWDGDAFKKMENLKTLIIRSGLFSRGPNHLPNTLRVLEWRGYPSEHLPYDFDPEKLAICELRDSCFTSLGFAALLKKKIVNLTSLDFSQCQYLTYIPDVSCLSHLEKLSFRVCKNLDTIHSSVGFLKKLKILDASSCFKLKSFPPLKLISLEQFELKFCGSFKSFPEILGKMENITELSFPGTPIKKFPLSFRNLTRLRKLQLDHRSERRISCRDAAIFIQIISMMPELANIKASGWEGCVLPKEDGGAEKVSLIVSSNFKRLHLEHCNLSDDFFPTFLPYFANVKELDLPWNNFTVIPECIKEFRFLTRLNLDHCKRLQEIRRIPPNLKHFSAKECVSLTSACRSMLLNQELHEAGNTILYLPLSKIPKWFECRTRGSSISFWFRNKFPAVAICLVVGPVNMDFHPGVTWRVTVCYRPRVIINGNKQECDEVYLQTDCTCLFDSREIKLEDNLDEAVLENEWNHAKFVCEVKSSIFIKWGIHVLKQQSSMEDIRFTDPCRKRKLDDGVNISESQDQQLLKKQRLVNIEVAETQFVQQQQHMGVLSRMWNWALVFFISCCSSNQ